MTQFDIGILSGPRVREIRLFLSERMKAAIENANLTGLSIEPFNPVGNFDQAFYVATVNIKSSEKAEDALVNTWVCKKHRVPSMFHLFGDRIPNFELQDTDFQLVDSIVAGDLALRPCLSTIVFSTKALRLILEMDVRGLVEIGFFLGQPFIPCVSIG